MKRLLGVLCLSVGLALSGFANSYYIWNNPAGGNFSDPANWVTTGGTDDAVCDPAKKTGITYLPAERCPGADDIVGFADGSCTIRLTADTTVGQIFHYTDGKLANKDRDRSILLDLNGKRLTVSQFDVIASRGSSGAFEMVVSNGTLTCATAYKVGIRIRNWGQRCGRLSFYDTVLDVTGQLVCSVNGVAPPTSWLRIGNGCTTTAALTQFYGAAGPEAEYIVTGDRTVVSGAFSGYSIAAMTVSDGACVDGKNQPLQCATAERLNARMTIDNATVTNVSSIVSGFRATSDYQTVLITNKAVVRANNGVTVGNGEKASSGYVLSGNNRVIVADGSVLKCTEVHLGRMQETNNWMIVDNASVTGTVVWVGSYCPLTINSVTYQGTASNNCFCVRGQAPHVTLTDKYAFYLRYGGRLRFEIPAEGWTEPPIVCTHNYSAVSVGASTIPGYENLENRLEISADAFAKAHPKTKVRLMSLTGADEAGLQAYAERFVYTGKARYAGKVTYDAHGLWYTTPPAKGFAIIVR